MTHTITDAQKPYIPALCYRSGKWSKEQVLDAIDQLSTIQDKLTVLASISGLLPLSEVWQAYSVIFLPNETSFTRAIQPELALQIVRQSTDYWIHNVSPAVLTGQLLKSYSPEQMLVQANTIQDLQLRYSALLNAVIGLSPTLSDAVHTEVLQYILANVEDPARLNLGYELLIQASENWAKQHFQRLLAAMCVGLTTRNSYGLNHRILVDMLFWSIPSDALATLNLPIHYRSAEELVELSTSLQLKQRYRQLLQSGLLNPTTVFKDLAPKCPPRYRTAFLLYNALASDTPENIAALLQYSSVQDVFAALPDVHCGRSRSLFTKLVEHASFQQRLHIIRSYPLIPHYTDIVAVAINQSSHTEAIDIIEQLQSPSLRDQWALNLMQTAKIDDCLRLQTLLSPEAQFRGKALIFARFPDQYILKEAKVLELLAGDVGNEHRSKIAKLWIEQHSEEECLQARSFLRRIASTEPSNKVRAEIYQSLLLRINTPDTELATEFCRLVLLPTPLKDFVSLFRPLVDHLPIPLVYAVTLTIESQREQTIVLIMLQALFGEKFRDELPQDWDMTARDTLSSDRDVPRIVECCAQLPTNLALPLVRKLGQVQLRALAIAQIAASAPLPMQPKLAQEALAVARSVPSMYDTSRVIATICGILPNDQALTLAWTMGDVQLRFETILAIAQRFSGGEQLAIIQSLLSENTHNSNIATQLSKLSVDCLVSLRTNTSGINRAPAVEQIVEALAIKAHSGIIEGVDVLVRFVYQYYLTTQQPDYRFLQCLPAMMAVQVVKMFDAPKDRAYHLSIVCPRLSHNEICSLLSTEESVVVRYPLISSKRSRPTEFDVRPYLVEVLQEIARQEVYNWEEIQWLIHGITDELRKQCEPIIVQIIRKNRNIVYHTSLWRQMLSLLSPVGVRACLRERIEFDAKHWEAIWTVLVETAQHDFGFNQLVYIRAIANRLTDPYQRDVELVGMAKRARLPVALLVQSHIHNQALKAQVECHIAKQTVDIREKVELVRMLPTTADVVKMLPELLYQLSEETALELLAVLQDPLDIAMVLCRAHQWNHSTPSIKLEQLLIASLERIGDVSFEVDAITKLQSSPYSRNLQQYVTRLLQQVLELPDIEQRTQLLTQLGMVVTNDQLPTLLLETGIATMDDDVFQ